MHLRFFEATGTQARYGLNRKYEGPVVEADSTELDKDGEGQLNDMVRVQVQGPDGRYARAYVRARLNAQGRVQFELSTNKHTGTTRANVTANWRL